MGEDVYCNSLCRTDFGDIRFTDDNNNLLDYWMQIKSDGSNAVFWVKIAGSLEVTSQTVYVYYGKSDAATSSNQAGTFVDVVSGVVGAWNMEDPTGNTITDFSGNGNNGTASGTTVVASKFAGKNARQIFLGDLINLGNKSQYNLATQGNTTGVTFEFLFKCGSQTIDFARLYSRFTGGTPGAGYYAGIRTTGKVQSDWRATTNPAQPQTANVYTDNNWHVLHVVYNPLMAAMYLDNVADGSDPYTADLIDQNAIMTLSDSTAKFAGYFGRFIIYSSALTASQRANIVANYPDVTLEAGKVCVRKYTSSTQPSHDAWGGLEHLVAASDMFSAADVVFRDRLLGVSDSVGMSDALLGSKGLLISDSASAFDAAKALKTLLVYDAINLADLVLALKGIGVADWAVLSDSASVPVRVRIVLDSVCLAEGLAVNKALMVAEDFFAVETVEVGTGDRRTRLFLVLGNVAVQLTKP